MKGAQILIVSDGCGFPPERPPPLPNEASDVRRSHYLRRGSVPYIYTERRRAGVGQNRILVLLKCIGTGRKGLKLDSRLYAYAVRVWGFACQSTYSMT